MGLATMGLKSTNHWPFAVIEKQIHTYKIPWKIEWDLTNGPLSKVL